MDKKQITFRDAAVDDFDRIVELYKQLYLNQYVIEHEKKANVKDPKRYFVSRDFKKEVNWRKKWISDRTMKVIVAIYEGKIIGYTNGSVKRHPSAKAKILFGDEVVIDEDFRHNGIGDLLIKQLIAWGKEKGARQMMIFVFKENKPLRNKYSSLGFKEKHICLYKPI